MGDPIIRELEFEQDSHGMPRLDEFIASNVDIHFEMMGDARFWIGVRDPATRRRWMLNCGSLNPQGKGYSRVEEDT